MRSIGLIAVGLLAACPAPGPVVPPAECLSAFPSLLDFGEIETSTRRGLPLRITNVTGSAVVLSIKEPGPMFRLSPSLNLHSQALPPGGSVSVEVEFSAVDSRLTLAELELNTASGCRAIVPLRGLGSGLVIAAASADFGFVAPGQSRTLEVEFLNTRRTPAIISGLHSSHPAFTAPMVPAELELPPMSSTFVLVTATPPRDDTFSAELVGITRAGSISTSLRVVGGAPIAALSPAGFTVPRVGRFSFAERTATLRNVSTAGRSSDAQLRLVDPFVVIAALDGGFAGELTASTLIPALPLGTSAEVVLHFSPISLGARSYEVTLFTNDPVAPAQRLSFEANVEPMPDCQLTFSPASELTLAPAAGGMLEGTIDFVNSGSTECVVDDLRLNESDPSGIHLAAGPENQVTIAAGTTHVVTLRSPVLPFGTQASLGFHVFNRISLRQFVTVRTPP